MLSKLGRSTVDWIINIIPLTILVRLHWTLLINRVTGHIKNSAHYSFTYGHADGITLINELHSTLEPLGGTHRHGAHPVVTQMLLHLKGQLGGFASHLKLNGKRVVNAGQVVCKLRVYHRSDNLYNFAFVHIVN